MLPYPVIFLLVVIVFCAIGIQYCDHYKISATGNKVNSITIIKNILVGTMLVSASILCYFRLQGVI